MRRLCIVLIWLAALASLQAQDKVDLIHTVGAGETLISIASAYGVTLDQLLTLNSLDPEAYLQIGQVLIVIPDAVEADIEEEEDEAPSGQEADEIVAVDGQRAAPVIKASAPMMDPADISPQLCFILFADENYNGMREPGEVRLRDGEVVLFDGSGAEQLHYTTDGESEPYCLRDLGRTLYRVDAVAPAGYGLTGAASLWLDLRAGGKVQLEFGARHGLKTVAIPAQEAITDIETVPGAEAEGLLRELSGLVVLAVAGSVFFSGMVVSLFLRGR